MSSENNNSTDQKRTEKNETFRIRFGHYFDIFYRVMKGLFGIIALLVLVVGALGGGTVIGYFASLVDDIPIPTQAEMSSQVNSYGIKSSMYYGDNSLISDLRSDLFRSPVLLDQMSPFVLNGVIATEDENFYEHEGIVPKALIRAGLQEVTNAATVTGGSTLTQQLVKQQILSADVTHSRKAVEILYATHLENNFEKDAILEAYMNISPFGRNNRGQNIAGIEEAAQGIFGVSAADLTLPQASFLAGLPKSPISYSPYTQYGEVKEDLSAGLYRQSEVLYSMYREGYLTEEVYNEAKNYDVTADFLRREDGDMSDPARSYVYDLIKEQAIEIFIDMLIEEDGITREQIDNNKELLAQYKEKADVEMTNGGYDIYSTIDPVIHNAVEETIQQNLDRLGSTRSSEKVDANGELIRDDNGEVIIDEFPVQVGGAILENETGKVLAFIGGRSYQDDEWNNAFQSRRGTGSAIKPILVYGPALAENLITPATIIPDTAVSIPSNGEPWTPGNYGRTTGEWRDARHWLAVSQNLPNIKIFTEMQKRGINYAQYIRAMGIGEDAISDYELSLPSLSLGGTSTGPTPVEVTGAYSMIGNRGVFNEQYVIERIVNNAGEVIYQHELNPTRVWPEDANYLLYDMLRDVIRTGTGRGLPGQLNFSVDLASKSGTTNDFADVWYVGATPKISVSSWMGYGNQKFKLTNEYGGSPSQRNVRLFAQIMNTINRVKPEVLGKGERVSPPTDGSVKTDTVLAETGMKAGNITLANDRTVAVTGTSKSELFRSSNIPGTTVYDFAVGATPAETKGFWDGLFTSQEEERLAEEAEAQAEAEALAAEAEAEALENQENEIEADTPAPPTPPTPPVIEPTQPVTPPPGNNGGQ